MILAEFKNSFPVQKQLLTWLKEWLIRQGQGGEGGWGHWKKKMQENPTPHEAVSNCSN